MELGKAIYLKLNPVFRNGKCVSITEPIEIRIMAIAEGWAMVRRKRAIPFVCKITELRQEDSHE